ncbi:hypothetical protein ACF0H5_007578 [Mactra antiquata]
MGTNIVPVLLYIDVCIWKSDCFNTINAVKLTFYKYVIYYNCKPYIDTTSMIFILFKWDEIYVTIWRQVFDQLILGLCKKEFSKQHQDVHSDTKVTRLELYIM